MGISADGKLITKPVSLNDIRRMFNLDANFNGTIQQIFTQASTNMWAKYRPFLANRQGSGSSVYHLGFLNGSLSNNPDPVNETTFNTAAWVDFYGNAGATDQDDTNYRYDQGVALGNATRVEPTRVYYDGNNKQIYTGNSGDLHSTWNITKPLPDARFYRLTDFSGYYHDAVPTELVYFPSLIYKNEFGIYISSLTNNNDYKKYCLSCISLFNTSLADVDYRHYSLGMMFTEQGIDLYGKSLVINTAIQLGYYSSREGILSAVGSSTTSFYLKPVNNVSGSGEMKSALLIRDVNGYSNSSNAPWWVVAKLGKGSFTFNVYIDNFPEEYKSYFVNGRNYTAQLVAINADAGSNLNNIFILPNFGSTVPYTQYTYNENIYSLNIINSFACKKSLSYTSSSRPSSGVVYYDKDGKPYNGEGGGGGGYSRPTYDIEFTDVRVNTNHMILRYNGQEEFGSNTFRKWKYANDLNPSSSDWSSIYITYRVINYNSHGYTQGVYHSIIPDIVDKNIASFFVTKNPADSDPPTSHYSNWINDSNRSDILKYGMASGSSIVETQSPSIYIQGNTSSAQTILLYLKLRTDDASEGSYRNQIPYTSTNDHPESNTYYFSIGYRYEYPTHIGTGTYPLRVDIAGVPG